MDYIELTDVASADAKEVELGKALAVKLGVAYPMPPDIVGPGTFPCGLTVATPYVQLTAAQQAIVPKQTHAVRALRLDGGVLLLPVDAEIAKLQGVVVGGKAVDVTSAKQESALSAKAKAALQSHRDAIAAQAVDAKAEESVKP